VSKTCIFCEIVAGRAAASLLFEDESTLAFMDLAQPSRGHSLVIPKQHVQDIYGMDDALGVALFATTRRVAEATKRAFEPPAVTVWQQNGRPLAGGTALALPRAAALAWRRCGASLAGR
jgi:histidine triad (HIT) family protein